MAYDFTSLSPDDFEALVNDLLSREWNVRLESFKAGSDQGIDLRYSADRDGDGATIVQCKRYGPNKYGALLSALEKEKEKAAALKPDRYVLATSVPLSPKQKEKLKGVLSPWCVTTHDILGASDLNALIRRYPDVEHNHFKLWISSTSVLEQILHASIFATSDDEIESLKLQLSKLVVHGGLDRALDILESEHHVVIVGNPGIGKTTLARMLLSNYLAQDYEPVVVTGDIEHAWSILHSAEKAGRKIIIYYDDFLGRIRFDLEKFAKNEESSILRLMDKVRRSDGLRFILTTREYILADAQRIHGAFAARAGELMLCTVSLDDYTRTNRAQILFNHLYFSDLPDSKLERLVQARAYRKIVEHRHFNPRVVETICKNANSRTVGDDDFIAYIESQLENPAMIWEHAFLNDISDVARLVLVLLWSFDGVVDLESLRDGIFASDASASATEVSLRFDESIRQLDGNFIATKPYDVFGQKGAAIVATFHNPSVEEFIGSWLRHQPEFLSRAIASAANLEQLYKIATCLQAGDITGRRRDQLWMSVRSMAVRCRGELIGRISNLDIGAANFITRWKHEPIIAARECLILWRIEHECGRNDEFTEQLERQILTSDGWQALMKGAAYDYSIAEATRALFRWIVNGSDWSGDKVEEALAAYTMALIATVDDDDIATMTMSTYQDLLAPARPVLGTLDEAAIAKLVAAIRGSVEQALDNVSDSNWLDSEAEDLEEIQALLDCDFKDEIIRLRRASQELEEDAKPRQPAGETTRYLESEVHLDLDRYFSELLNR